MNYEQKYNEVLQKAKEEYNRLGELGNESMKRRFEIIFPELNESEDERIREEIIKFIQDFCNPCDPEGDKWIAYLEKLKEQPKEELVYRLNGLMQDYIKEGEDEEEREHRYKCYQLFWDALEDAEFFQQKEQQPAECIPDSVKFDEGFKTGREVGFREGVESVKPAEWSEDDEDFINMLILHFNYLIDKGGDSVETYKSYRERLKSLRPSWKPSEEQMKILNWAASGMVDKSIAAPEMRAVLRELYEQLKAL